MRYVLGINIQNKITGEVSDGYAMIDCLGLYPNLYKEEEILKRIEENKPIYTIVYPDIESIQKDISRFSETFRRDDVWNNARKWEKSKYIRKFYAIKVDTPKFPFKIGEPYKSDKKKFKDEPIFNICKKDLIYT